MKALLTGATGFIGYNLASYLTNKGWRIICVSKDVDKKCPELPGQKIDAPWAETPWQEIGQVNVLIHHAAITDTSYTDKNSIFKKNAYDAIAFFETALRNSCSRIVYASSMQVYGNASLPFKEDAPVGPLNLYAKSKRMLEEEATKLAQEYNNTVIIGLRYGNIYGPGENHKGKMASMVTQIGWQMLVRDPVLYKYGEQRRDFIYITDVLEAIHASIQAEESTILNIGSGKGTSFNRIVELFNNEFGTNRKPVYIDNPFEGKYQDEVILDISLAKEKLGFKPKVSIEQGIHLCVESGVFGYNT
jgi:ADP-L-glycero-D-manno-heptose 6-epimerase